MGRGGPEVGGRPGGRGRHSGKKTAKPLAAHLDDLDVRREGVDDLRALVRLHDGADLWTKAGRGGGGEVNRSPWFLAEIAAAMETSRPGTCLGLGRRRKTKSCSIPLSPNPPCARTLSFLSLSRACTTLAPIGPVTPTTAIMGRPVNRARRSAAPIATTTGPGMSRRRSPPSLKSRTWVLSSEWPSGVKGAIFSV